MHEPKRILHVFAQMNRGGAETMIMNFYRNIDRSKVQFDFIVHTDDRCHFDDEIEELGGKIYRFPAYKGWNSKEYLHEWDSFLNNNPGYKVIHGHVRSIAAIYLNKAKKYGLTTISHSHNTSSGKGAVAIVKNILQYPIRYIADYFFACSLPAGKWLFGNEVIKKGNFFVINNSIPVKNFVFDDNKRKLIRKEFNIENKFVIGHVGRFHEQKNHKFLIEIFKGIYEKNKDAVLMLVGDGDEKKRIENLVEDFGLNDNVIFTGVRSDISSLLQAMDIFAFPSFYEGLGIVVVEAQAAGLKCIVSDKLPSEVEVTNLIEFKQINSADEWCNQILRYNKGYERVNTYNQIKTKGYDIEESSKWLESFYLKMH